VLVTLRLRGGGFTVFPFASILKQQWDLRESPTNPRSCSILVRISCGIFTYFQSVDQSFYDYPALTHFLLPRQLLSGGP
jgi:hypothetical protein